MSVKMNLSILNATQQTLESQKHNIFIGISTGTKPMPQEAGIEYLNWAEAHANNTVQILIADEISKYNYLALGHNTKKGAVSRATRDGDVYQAYFENILDSYPPEKRDRFNIVRWKDIQSKKFDSLLERVLNEFELNKHFKEFILSLVDKHIEKRNKTLPLEKRLLLSQYLLHELPTILEGIHLNGEHYNLMLYPTFKYSGMYALISEMMRQNKMCSILEEFDFSKTIVVESLMQLPSQTNVVAEKKPNFLPSFITSYYNPELQAI